ncbi:MAG TPA: hypothetical protein VH477_05000 [Bryobacteraceae bacterium]
MNEQSERQQAKPSRVPPYKINLPALITEDEVGLGDVVKRVTATIGFRSCAGCERRAATLNRWLAFTGRPK